MVGFELALRKHWGKLSFLMLFVVVALLNPVSGVRESFLQSVNEARTKVEKGFDNSLKGDEGRILKENMNLIAKTHPELFELVLLRNSFSKGEFESLAPEGGFYDSITDQALKDILDLELALKSRDAEALKVLHGSLEDTDLKDYIVYALKTLDPDTELDFSPGSAMRAMYIK